jgi:hypothetical protein
MKASVVMAEEELVRKAVQFLIKRFGPIDAQRFLSLNAAGREESVKRHRNWQRGLNKERFLAKAIQ